MINKVPPIFPEKMSDDVYNACVKEYKYGTVYVGSPCNLKCFYCSEFWNPPNLIPDHGGFLTIDEIKHFLTFVSDDLDKHLDYIGASITRAGEFFLHPQSLEILEYIKDKGFTLNLIDTNGMHITEEHAKILVGGWIDDVAVHLTNYNGTKEGLDWLDKYNINYSISIIPSRMELDSTRLDSWVESLQSHKARWITLGKPGYTKYTPKKLQEKLMISEEEMWFISKKLQKKYPKIPITVDIDLSAYGMAGAEILLSIQFIIKHHIRDVYKDKVLFLIAKSVEGIFEEIVEFLTPIKNYKVITVKNKTFGGNIKVAGLLTVDDYISEIEEVLKSGYNPEFIVCSNDSFLYDNEDLRGLTPKSIEDRFDISTIIC